MGWQRGKQNYICFQCGRQFIDSYESKDYSEELKRECLEMYYSCILIHSIIFLVSFSAVQLLFLSTAKHLCWLPPSEALFQAR